MRLLTRMDFDGLACGTILKRLGLIKSYKFVHPKDMQSGLVQIGENDVLANVPYAEGCKMWFDHHTSEAERLGDIKFEGASKPLDSAARVIYEYYGGREWHPEFEEMVSAVDKVDSAKLSVEEILNPSGWILLGFIMDPRTGLGRFNQFRIGVFELAEQLMDACCNMTIDEILNLPDVMERVDFYFEQDAKFRAMIKAHTRLDDNIIITDLRGITPIYSGNRFLIYSLYPQCNISVWIVDGQNRRNCSIAVGHSVIKRGSGVNVGSLMLKYGGGGHPRVGTCQVEYEDADRVIAEICGVIRE